MDPNDYMMQNSNGSYMDSGMNRSADTEEISRHLKTGNVLKAVTLVSVIAVGGVLIAMQIKNSKEIADIAKDVDKLGSEVSDISNMTDEITANVYSIMEQGCTGSAGGSYAAPTPTPYPYYIDPGLEVDKPAIYIYPDEDMTADTGMFSDDNTPLSEVHVKLSLYRTDMISMWPDADQVDAYMYYWNMYAAPDGTLYDSNGNEYTYIFWEAGDHGVHDFSKGFCVAGEDTAEFLRNTLSQIGLTPAEYNEFIVYWLPRMQGNAYNLITFEGLEKNDAYNSYYGLEVTDAHGNEAESVLRVMMVWKPVDEYTEIEPQVFTGFERNGFTIVEWGGSELPEYVQ
ncbi:MAG: hypothetical protein IKR23_08860 [Lachnospiraceae bacterium]|nr:hypothetical protein [Lachnospiraceae bacterium]